MKSVHDEVSEWKRLHAGQAVAEDKKVYRNVSFIWRGFMRTNKFIQLANALERRIMNEVRKK